MKAAAVRSAWMIAALWLAMFILGVRPTHASPILEVPPPPRIDFIQPEVVECDDRLIVLGPECPLKNFACLIFRDRGWEPVRWTPSEFNAHCKSPFFFMPGEDWDSSNVQVGGLSFALAQEPGDTRGEYGLGKVYKYGVKISRGEMTSIVYFYTLSTCHAHKKCNRNPRNRCGLHVDDHLYLCEPPGYFHTDTRHAYFDIANTDFSTTIVDLSELSDLYNDLCSLHLYVTRSDETLTPGELSLRYHKCLNDQKTRQP